MSNSEESEHSAPESEEEQSQEAPPRKRAKLSVLKRNGADLLLTVLQHKEQLEECPLSTAEYLEAVVDTLEEVKDLSTTMKIKVQQTVKMLEAVLESLPGGEEENLKPTDLLQYLNSLPQLEDTMYQTSFTVIQYKTLLSYLEISDLTAKASQDNTSSSASTGATSMSSTTATSTKTIANAPLFEKRKQKLDISDNMSEALADLSQDVLPLKMQASYTSISKQVDGESSTAKLKEKYQDLFVTLTVTRVQDLKKLPVGTPPSSYWKQRYLTVNVNCYTETKHGDQIRQGCWMIEEAAKQSLKKGKKNVVMSKKNFKKYQPY
uniref:NS2 n=1 Tax=uncultured densovirus TaxID=748192 RepID=A0A7L7YTI9_9VIRU|nr:NS2 [uncultured densovirus]